MRAILFALLFTTGVFAQNFRVTAPERAVQMRVEVLYARTSSRASSPRRRPPSRSRPTARRHTMGQIITTSGELSFRFGDFLNHKDTEAMRLSPEGSGSKH